MESTGVFQSTVMIILDLDRKVLRVTFGKALMLRLLKRSD